MQHELYIYWRVAPADADAACAAMRAWQHTLTLDVRGLRPRLLRRVENAAVPGTAQPSVTLMEIYAISGQHPGMTPAVQQRIIDGGNAASAPWRQGVRHVELFDGSEPAEEPGA